MYTGSCVLLWRSLLVFHWWQICILGNPPLPNPFGDPNLSQPIMPIQQNVADILFVRTSYVKKIIEDCSNSEETVKLLRFCCWENPQFSSTVLSELLWQVKENTRSSSSIIWFVNSFKLFTVSYLFLGCIFLHLRTPALFGSAFANLADWGLLADSQVSTLVCYLPVQLLD